MKTERDRTASGRRDFLKLASLGSVLGGAALLVRGTEAEAAEPGETRPGGYRLTEHIRTFYESARF